MEIKIQLETITPEIAKELLHNNEGNRVISDGNVQFFYNQMVSDEWLLTGDTIKIGKDGRLLDGQHRLLAVVKFGRPVKMFVARGCDGGIFKVLDTGKTRSAGDILSIKGYKNVHNVAGAAKFIMLFKRGYYNAAKANRSYKPTNGEVLQFVEKNPEIIEIINYSNSIYRQSRWLSCTVLAGLYYILSGRNQKEADSFFEKYATGIDLSETSPIRHLRERFLRDSMNKSKLGLREKLALFIFSWNAYLKRTKMQQLTLQKNYVFPKPI